MLKTELLILSFISPLVFTDWVHEPFLWEEAEAGFAMYLCLVPYSPGWPSSSRQPSCLTWVLAFQVCATTPGLNGTLVNPVAQAILCNVPSLSTSSSLPPEILGRSFPFLTVVGSNFLIPDSALSILWSMFLLLSARLIILCCCVCMCGTHFQLCHLSSPRSQTGKLWGGIRSCNSVLDYVLAMCKNLDSIPSIKQKMWIRLSYPSLRHSGFHCT